MRHCHQTIFTYLRMVFFHSSKIFIIGVLSSLSDKTYILAPSKAVSIVYYFPVYDDTFMFVCRKIFLLKTGHFRKCIFAAMYADPFLHVVAVVICFIDYLFSDLDEWFL